MRITGITLFILTACFLTAPPATAQSLPDLHLALGNPSNATTSIEDETNYLIERPQYALSYSRWEGAPNWVSWHLGYPDLGGADRSSFRTDTSLPGGWYRVTTSNYTGTGYDRGHLCPSGDRTATPSDNQATFLMTNIIPQAPDNNQGPWAELEDYCRDLVRQGNELYIICGADGSLGAIAAGRVNIPAYTWKVIVILPEGDDDLERISTDTHVIAVDIENRNGIRHHDWRDYRVSVDWLEYYTGHDFLSNIPDDIEDILEAWVDTQ
jgi:endonuclease G